MTDMQAVAAEAFAVLDTGRQIAPFSSRLAHFDLDDAYRVTAAVRQMRETRGEIPLGRKIGFTNRTIWDEYQIGAPMWGYIYDRTVHDLADVGPTVSLAGLAEPRIEPEIIFGLSGRAGAGYGRARLARMRRLGGARLRARAVDLSALGIHIARHGGGVRPARQAPHRPSAPDRGHGRRLGTGTSRHFASISERDGTVVDQGRASNVLGGPLSALTAPRRGAGQRSGQSATRRRRDRHHRDADARVSRRAGRNLDDRADGRRPRRHRDPLRLSAGALPVESAPCMGSVCAWHEVSDIPVRWPDDRS